MLKFSMNSVRGILGSLALALSSGLALAQTDDFESPVPQKPSDMLMQELLKHFDLSQLMMMQEALKSHVDALTPPAMAYYECLSGGNSQIDPRQLSLDELLALAAGKAQQCRGQFDHLRAEIKRLMPQSDLSGKSAQHYRELVEKSL